MNLRFWSDVTRVALPTPLELAYPNNLKQTRKFHRTNMYANSQNYDIIISKKSRKRINRFIFPTTICMKAPENGSGEING